MIIPSNSIQTLLYNSNPILPAKIANINIDDLLMTIDSPLATGIVFYVSGLIFLSAWEKWVVPSLKLNSILPDVPLLPEQLNEKERKVKFITPLTSSMSVPPPSLENLRERGKYIVGHVDDVNQFITCESRSHVDGVCESSLEGSAYYGTEITIFKERKR